MERTNKNQVRSIKNVIAISLISFVFGLGACTYDTVELVTPENVSFNNDIIPFFEASCAITGCHVAGGIKPNLQANSAYSSLTKGDYINTESADQSKIYDKISTGSMAKYASSQDRAILLKWIEKGANNN